MALSRVGHFISVDTKKNQSTISRRTCPYIQYNNVLLVTELYTHNTFNTTMYYWSLNYTHTIHSIQQCTTGH